MSTIYTTQLSLFDGISNGQEALKRSGIKVNNYYSSEVDKYAMSVTRYNFPNTIFLGDVEKITVNQISQFKVLINQTHIVDTRKVLLLGGSPCQGFSFVGKMCGASTTCKIEITNLQQYLQLKADGFEFQGQSYLIWEYIRIKEALQSVCKTKLPFLLENVKLSNKWKSVFDTAVGVSPILINSELVSAQKRPRYYWTSGDNLLPPPVDRKVCLSDILEKNVDEKFYLSDKAIAYINREDRITKKLTAINGSKALCLMSQYDQSKNGTFLCVDANGRIDSSKTGTLTQRYYKGSENYGSNPFILETETNRYRKFTPIECERLQTISDNYTKYGIDDKANRIQISNTQRYKMIGNGWTVDVISHLLSFLKLNLK